MSAEPVRLMTMRVIRIRDGRVIEQRPKVEITSDAELDPYGITYAWPPCRCPRHRETAE
ncbi:hypothetical protein [Streptomyces sp. NPDC005876]|uniref:hypothetical protein n=1 Tax=unclassified Streptomyces TaxID=2593676 RepID=UPI0033E4EAFE